jgi:hypothetical protein
MLKRITLFFFGLVICLPAYGWNCTGNNIRVQVPSGTTGTGTGDGPGQVVTVQGLTFECEPPASTAPPSAMNTNTNSSNSNSSANSNSTSNSNSNSSASSNQTQGQKQGQSQTSNNQSGVSDVGNSETTVDSSRIPVNTAIAPPVFSTANCFKGYGAGIQTMAIGGSFGGGGIDRNCAALSTAQALYAIGSREGACRVIINTKAAKDAHVTLEECLATMPPRVIVVTQPAPPVPAPAPVIVYVPVQHETVTVTATKAEVKAACKPTAKKAPVKHRPCVVPDSLKGKS